MKLKMKINKLNKIINSKYLKIKINIF